MSQPLLHSHFRPTKRSAAGGTSSVTSKSNNVDGNSFVKDVTSASIPSLSSESHRQKVPISTNRDDNDFIYPNASESSFLRPARSLPLSDHQSTLLSLHSAVEHALIVHLATSGGTPIDSTISATSVIQLPCIITFTTLRPIVERSCGRRLGPNELSRLMWIWGSSSNAEGMTSGSNVGFHISKGKTMDRAGNRSYDYFFSLQVGIELPTDDESDDEKDDNANARRRRKRILSGESTPGEIPMTPPRKRLHPLDLPDEPETPSPSPRSINVFAKQSNLVTPPLSPSINRTPIGSPLKSKGRGSLSSSGSLLSSPLLNQNGGRGPSSAIAMWNSGIDGRKREVRRRLQRWSLDCYETWLENKEIPVPQSETLRQADDINMEPIARPCTPPPSIRRAVEGQGGIMTPSSTREDDWVPGQKRVVNLFDKDALQRRKLIRKWDPSFPLKKVAPLPLAKLPEAPTTTTTIATTLQQGPSQPVLRPGRIIPAASIASKANSSLSLAERIKAKEEAKKAQMQARSGLRLMNSDGAELLGDLHTSRSSMMANLKRKSALSRLQDVAESLYMLFSSKAAAISSSSCSTEQSMIRGAAAAAAAEGIKRYPLLPMNDVTKSICTSSKVAMSEIEARESFKMLQEVAPGFVEINRVGAREWIRMGNSIGAADADAGKQGGILNAVRRRIRVEMTKN